MKKLFSILAVSIIAIGSVHAVKAEDTAVEAVSTQEEQIDYTYEVHIKDHMFSPIEITVPAGQKFKLVVFNDDPTPEEFESEDLRREKIIPGNTSATILIGPVEAGKYSFFGEFNEDTAKGYIIAE